MTAPSPHSQPKAEPVRQHSEAAWKIASRYSHVLASETRDLAAQIDDGFASLRSRVEVLEKEGSRIGIEKAMEIVANLRQSGAAQFSDPKYCGQRVCDRLDALYDAYVAIRATLNAGEGE